MLALFLVLLSFGSYCSSAPIEREKIRTMIEEALSKVDSIKSSEVQDLLTPTHKMEKRCTLKKLSIFIESLKRLNTNGDIKLLLFKLNTIKTELKECIPELKESEPDCEGGQVGFEEFTKKLSKFLKFTNEKFGSLY